MFGDFIESGILDLMRESDLLKLFLFSCIDFWILDILAETSEFLGFSMKGLTILLSYPLILSKISSLSKIKQIIKKITLIDFCSKKSALF